MAYTPTSKRRRVNIRSLQGPAGRYLGRSAVRNGGGLESLMDLVRGNVGGAFGFAGPPPAFGAMFSDPSLAPRMNLMMRPDIGPSEAAQLGASGQGVIPRGPTGRYLDELIGGQNPADWTARTSSRSGAGSRLAR